jgi:hypothetical protein
MYQNFSDIICKHVCDISVHKTSHVELKWFINCHHIGNTYKTNVIAMSISVPQKINYYVKDRIVFLRCFTYKFRPIHLVMLMFLLLPKSE